MAHSVKNGGVKWGVCLEYLEIDLFYMFQKSK